MDFRKGLRLPTLTKYLKGILEQYPDDGQILKELIQNADDAGAKTVRFLLDEGQYESSPEGLIHPDMAQFQGPALLVYNDAVFSEDDWNGICMMAESIKEKDVIQTGRFGLGFKSIFHVTDLPIIASGDYVGIIDPHQKYLPRWASAYNWHLGDEKDYIQSKEEQFRPLFKGIFGLDANILSNADRYNHTAFRFPLRREANPLSANIYTAEKVLQLFRSLEVDEGQSLLFLKSVQCIEIYRQSDVVDEPKLLYRMKIAENTAKQVSERRKVFLEKVCQEEWRSKNVETILQMTVQVEHFQPDGMSLETNDWLVYHTCHGDKAVIDAAAELKFLPWVGIALPLSKSRDLKDQICEPTGHLFVTLPLPLDGTERTGLAFHVHAYFAMEQNRRHLRWPTPDQNQEDLDSIRLQWNQLLVRQCIPAAVVAFFRHAISSPDSEISITPDNLYELLPNEDSVDAKWRPVVSRIYKELFTDSCLYSPAKDKGWLKVEDTIRSDDHLPDQVNKLLKQVLLTAGYPVTNVPPHIQTAVKKYSLKQQNRISATDVHNAALQVTKNGYRLEREDAVLLLQYFLDNGQPQDLIGLPLLPLMSGEMASFQQARASTPIFLSSKEHPAALLPGLEQRLVDPTLEDQLLSSLQRLSKTGKTHLKQLRFRDILEILPQVLPSSWAEFDVVPWSPDDRAQPSLTWLEHIWDYIHLNCPSVQEWKMLENLHLLPIDNCQMLSKFSVGKRIILGQTEENVLPMGVVNFLSHVGCIILRECPDFVYRHKDLLYHSVHLPTCQGITDALISVGLKSGEAFNEQVKQNLSLNEFLAYMSDSGIRLLSSKGKQFLSSIPLFSTVNGSGFQPSRNVSLNEVNVSDPSLELPVPFPVPVINVSNEKVKYILEALDVCRYHHDSSPQIVKQILLPAMKAKQYTDEQVDDLLCHIMDHHANVILEHVDIAAEISELVFVEAGLRERQSPKELYDPRDPILASFLGREFFPHQKYHTSERFACLEKLGMRPLKQISSALFLTIAKSLQTQPERSNDFIQLTKTLTKQAPLGKWWEKLRDVAFLSAVQLKPDGYPHNLPWKGSGAKVLAPKDVCHIRFAKQAGSAVPFVDLDETILAVLQAKITPSLDELIYHLKHIVENYNAKEKSRYLVLLDEVYSGLAPFREDDVCESLNRNSVSLWIWCGSGFKCAGQMLLEDLEIEISPYYYSLPPEIEMHQDLLHRCGVPNTVHLGQVLQAIAEKHMEEESQNASTATHDLHLAIKLLKVLCKEGAKTALVPIETPGASKLQFKPALECTVWDDSSESNDDDDLFYVHPSVPMEVVNHFCIPTVIHRELGEEIRVQDFGQNEPLTTRLQSVLQGYTDGLAVLKEMIQNADDAGATEVRLVYDMRENKQWRKSLLDPGMADWQGPSMWIYNNAVFTDEDFENIRKLNGATKKEKEDQIGTFGLGFNAVYNITDVPSVLSHNTLVIFDPHTTNLGRALRDKTKPGKKIPLARKLLRKYSDQFAPWNGVCGCNLEADSGNASFKGTLFRLPLRGHKQSVFSEISRNCYDDRNVNDLLKMVHRNGNNMLLFTQNVLKVSVSVIPGQGNGTDLQMKDLFEIHKEPVQYLHEHGIQSDMSYPSQAENLLAQKFINECSILKAAVSSNSRDGRRKELKSSMILKSVVETSEEGRLLLGETVSEPLTHWIVSQSIEDMPFVQGDTAKQQPVAGIAICLEKENGRYKIKPQDDSSGSPKGSYFSFLPLPVKSPLPFHINGTFVLDQSRRHLVQKTHHDKNLAGGAWNKGLMEGPVCTAYMTALSDIISLTAPDEDLATILPVNIKDDLITSMSETFWRRVIQDPEMLEIFLSPKGKVSLRDAYFLDQSLVHSCPDAECNVTEVIRSVFQGSSRTLVNLPMNLEQTLRDVDPEMLKSKMITEEVFFTEFFLPNTSSLPLQQRDRDVLLVRALKSTSSLVENTLKSKACIPVSPHGLQLAEPNTLIHPHGKAAPLYSPKDSKFPNFICDSDNDGKIVNERLCTLGMVRDNISWEEILERSRNLTRIGPQKHIEHVEYFLVYLRWKLTENDQIPGYIHQALRNERFLPTVVKPSDWTLNWKGEELPSYSGNELYSVEEPLIACMQIPILHRSIHISPDVAIFLGIKGGVTGHPVSIDIIKRQVQQITSNEESIKCVSVRKSLERIYQYLNQECIDENKAEKVRHAFAEQRFLIVEDSSVSSARQKLVSPAACAFHPQIQAFPYMNKVSEKYERLHMQLGIKDHFTCEQFITSIAMMKEDVMDSGLNETGLYMVKQMLHELCQQMKSENKSVQNFEDGIQIYIPDAMGVLKPVESLCYNDTPWVHTELEFPLVNYRIRNDVAAFLGVTELRAHALSERSHAIAYDEHVNLVEEMHSVLEAYPCGSPILMELLQQADNAGATEIHFKLDLRKHSTSNVFGNGWKTMQGPSLCVENDANLNRDAMAGLFLPGQANANSHGAGIQSVYHLTDTPTVLATLDDGTEMLCAYDPTFQYVEGTSPQKPGMMYEDVTLLKNFFPDVFGCYHQSEYGYADGTQFRFPLRTPEAAKGSPICQTPGTIEDVNAMLEDLLKEGYRALLFMTSLKKIKITRLNTRQGRFETEEITSTITENELQLIDFRQHLMLQKVQQTTDVAECKFQKAAYALRLNKSSGKEEEWSVVQHCGLQKGYHRIEDLSPEFLKVQKLPTGGVAELRHTNIGRHCQTPDYRYTAKKVRPREIPGHSDEGGRSDGNLLLPSHQRTNLPVQVFGPYQYVHSTEQDPSSNNALNENWNEYITEVIASAYLDLIKSNMESVKSSTNSRKPNAIQSSYRQIRQYFSVFPKDQGASSPVTEAIVKQLYELMTDAVVLPEDHLQETGTQWVTPSEACFYPEEDEIKHCNVIKGANLCGLKIVKCPCSVQKMIKGFCHGDPLYLSPGVLLKFLRDRQRCDYTPLCKLIESGRIRHDWTPGSNVVKDMITFCKADKSFSEQLDQIPLLLTSDGRLRAFDVRRPVYKSPDMKLLDPCSKKFLHPSFIEVFSTIESPVFKDMDIEGFCEEFGKNFPKCAQNKVIPLDQSIEQKWIEEIWKAIDKIVDIEIDLLKHHAGTLSIWLTKRGKILYLYPINEMGRVFERQERRGINTSEVYLHSQICEEDIPVSVYSSSVANSMAASFDRPRSVLHALHHYQQQQKYMVNIFRQRDLLEYFAKNSYHLRDDGDLLKDLPMFETLTDEYVPLAGHCVNVIPSQVPMVDMDAWTTPHRGILFLKEKSDFKDLYDRIGCIFWSTEEVYTEYIFKQLELLSNDGRLVHMQYALDNLHNSTTVIDAMRNLDCVRNIGNEYCKPSDLYDPTISLFERMQGADLPARDLRSAHRLQVLRKAGMTDAASQKMLATYAKRPHLKYDAHLILDYIRRHVGTAKQSEYLKFLSGIPFIPRKLSENSAVCPDKSDEDYVPLKGSVLVNHSDLAWSVAPLIEDYRASFTDSLISAGVIIEPSCELVACNVVQVCQHGQSEEMPSIGNRRKLSGLIDTCYNYISAKLENDECTEQDKKRLQEIMSDRCCVPVEQAGRFVKPNQAVLELTPNEEVKPYLYRLPDNLMNNKEVLKLLGVASKPTICAYQRVLSMIHDKFDSHVINNAEDIQAAKQATRQVFKRIKKDRSLNIQSSLWLLSKSNRLYKSQSIIYSNNLGTESRLTRNVKLLVDINLKVSIESILEYFPGTHRPQLLTSVVKEEVQDKEHIPTQSSNQVREHLASEAIEQGFQRLTYHIMVTNAQEDIDDTIHEKITEVQKIMQTIQIASVDLKTRLNSHNCIIGDWQGKMFFAERNTSVFYLDRSSLERRSDWFYMYIVLADMVNDLNKGFFREHMKVLMILLSTEPERIGERLDEMGILPYSP